MTNLMLSRTVVLQARHFSTKKEWKWTGAEMWKNWINWESPWRSQSDELNRKRHYFWWLDGKGRLFRKELHEPTKTFGQTKDEKFLDFFFQNLKENRTGLYLPEYPYLSLKMHEHYFLSYEISPIIFWHLENDRLRYAANLSVSFDPSLLRCDSHGRLFYPLSTSDQTRLWGATDVNVAQKLLERSDNDSTGNLQIEWNGKQYLLKALDQDVKGSPASPA